MKELLITHFLAIASIGPNTILMLDSSSSGSRAILQTALGITVAQLAHIGYSLMFGQVLPPYIINGLTALGCIYLVYIGYMTIKYASAENERVSGGFKKGLAVNLLNGKVTVYFVSIFPPLTSRLNSVELLSVVLFVSAMVFFWFLLVGSLGNLGRVRQFLDQYQVKLNYTFGGLFIAIALVIAKKSWLFQ